MTTFMKMRKAEEELCGYAKGELEIESSGVNVFNFRYLLNAQGKSM